jgi:hypothetical protein
LTHPLTLALIPAAASVLVGICAVFPRLEPQPTDKSTSAKPAVGHEADIAFHVDTDIEE